MSDVVVTVPKLLWEEWISEGDLPGLPASGYHSHFWVHSLPSIALGERVYVVAHGRLRGYAPLVGVEASCALNPARACLVRAAGAMAVTIPEPITGFRGWRYRWWDRGLEVPFPDWQRP